MSRIIGEGFKHARFLCLVMGICGNFFNPVSSQTPSMKTIFEWNILDFDYESEATRQADIDSKQFIPGVPTPIDVDVYYSHENGASKIFVTIPRYQQGSPLTLGTVSDKTKDGYHLLAPYPSWEWHRNPEQCNENRLITVYRVQIDECGRMWVLDTGRYNDVIICNPQILVFDLKTDTLLDRYEIPASQTESRSILTTIMVDVRDSCDNTFVYNGDCQTYSIIVYDAKRKVSWRITDKTMYPHPKFGTFKIGDDSFDLMDGILGMALSKYVPGKDRTLFYHALSSPYENWVKTSHLRNETLFAGNPYAAPQIFHTYVGKRNTQSAAEAIDSRGILYYGSISDVTMRCFNTRGEYGSRDSSDIIASDPETLQFPTGVKLIKDRKGVEELWILTDRLQKVSAGTLNNAEINFRILAAKTSDLIFGTRCAKKVV